MKFLIGSLPLILAFAAPVANAADPRIITYFQETCGTCHGETGLGTPGLAPPLHQNKFVTGGSDAEIGETITKGRDGAKKRYKDLPSPMPSQSMSDTRLQALITYLKVDLQHPAK